MARSVSSLGSSSSRSVTAAGTGGSWLVRWRRNPKARFRLFCFPHAGAGASAFRSWPGQLPLEVEICAVQLPGRETKLREAPITDLTGLVQKLAEVVSPYFDKQFGFFGHSMGGLISFELARRLRSEGKAGPVWLFISAYRAPQLPDPDTPIHELPDAALLADLRMLYGTAHSGWQDAELVELYLPVLRADLAVCETYAYAPDAPLDCPITVYGGLEDPKVKREELAGWRVQTRCAFDLRMIPGNHFFPQTSEWFFLQSLGRDLKQVLSSIP